MVFDCFSEVAKSVGNVEVLLGADLEVLNPEFLGHLLPLFKCYLPLLHVTLVPHQYFNHVLVGVHLDLPQPVLERLEGGEVVNRVGHDDAHGALVVGLGDGLEPFLACGVPDLKSYFFVLDFDGFDFEVDA